jgi:hypothetical protein
VRALPEEIMNTRQRNRAIELITNPPPGSKLAAAKEYGIDLTLLVENLALSPEERMRRGSAAANSCAVLRHAVEQSRAR